VRLEESLDPEDWDELRALGHRMLDDLMSELENIRETSHRFPSEADISNIFTSLSEDGEGEKYVYEVFKNHILPSVLLNRLIIHDLDLATSEKVGEIQAHFDIERIPLDFRDFS